MARITATEMVGVSFTTKEVQRLIAALEDGRLGPAEEADDTVLRKKLTVLLQTATAAEKRRAGSR